METMLKSALTGTGTTCGSTPCSQQAVRNVSGLQRDTSGLGQLHVDRANTGSLPWVIWTAPARCGGVCSIPHWHHDSWRNSGRSFQLVEKWIPEINRPQCKRSENAARIAERQQVEDETREALSVNPPPTIRQPPTKRFDSLPPGSLVLTAAWRHTYRMV